MDEQQLEGRSERKVMNLTYGDFISIFCRQLERFNDENGDILLSITMEESETGRPSVITVSTCDEKSIRVGCRVDAASACRKCRDAKDVQKLAGKVIYDLVQIVKTDCAGRLQALQSYDEARQGLFVRLVNMRHADPEAHICRRIGDIAMVVYFLFDDQGDYVHSMKVPRSFLNEWEKTESQVFSEALLNTMFLSPPRIYQLDSLLDDPEYGGLDFMAPEVKELPDHLSEYGCCLSTGKRTNGAVAAVLPGVCRKLAKLMDGEFYLAFTSVHEAMIHRTDSIDAQELANVLVDTIEAATPEEDILTRKVYRYNAQADSIEIAFPLEK